MRGTGADFGCGLRCGGDARQLGLEPRSMALRDLPKKPPSWEDPLLGRLLINGRPTSVIGGKADMARPGAFFPGTRIRPQRCGPLIDATKKRLRTRRNSQCQAKADHFPKELAAIQVAAQGYWAMY